MVENIHVRSALESIPSYVPGKPAPADAFKVSSNESPFEPLPEIRAALEKELAGLNRYPDMAATKLRELLAREHGVEPAQVHVSTGASAVLGDLVRALADQGDEVIFPWRSFEAYPILVQSHGAVAVPVPLTAHEEHDLDAIAAAVTERTRLILLCSPNNPTGTVLTTAELEAFLGRIPDHITVALDEAYVEFADPEVRADSARLFVRFENLVRVRTFSKVHGIAGLRLGYAIAHPRLAEALDKVAIPFGASSLAQIAACVALEEPARTELAARVEWIRAERSRVESALDRLDLGCARVPSHGNFVYLPLGERTGEFVQFALERGLVVRGYGSDGCRVTIAEEAANARFIDIAEAWQEQKS